MVIALLCLAQVVVVLDVTVVAIALPVIGADLGLSTTGLGWVANAYTLALGLGLLAGGRMADRFGARRIFLVGTGLFALASLVCGLAPSAAVLLAARVGQGGAAAMAVPAGLALVVALDRPRALGWWTAAAAGGGASGWVLGGVITGAVGWRWVFLVNVPVCVAVVLLGRRRLRGRGPDRLRPGPLIDLALLRRPGVAPANVVAAVLGASVTAAMFLSVLHAQNVLGLPPVEAGLLFPPFNLAVIAGSILGPAVVAAIGSARAMPVGLLSVAAGAVALIAIAPDAPALPTMLAGFVLLGFGSGLATVASTARGTAHAGDRAGLAAGLLSTSTQLGTALGVAAVAPLAAGYAAAFGGGPAADVAGFELGYGFAAALAAGTALAFAFAGRATGMEVTACPNSNAPTG
ncbi:MFS transporter [Pseudonocardia sp. TRM90224]|uniref:MFS transporter n=1 Tax=Pseudonocardia sp. TRM90224 TaxID=2812678 RepID=UPI001E578DD7|nr:MFS transporter [Pseudonocardia sp. TRM90224]